MEKYKTIFEFWTGVCAHARRDEWDEVRADLCAYTDYKLTAHFLNRETFERSVKAGHVDIVKEILNRGFTLAADAETDAGAEMLARITVPFNAAALKKALPAIQYLVCENKIDPAQALYTIAASGDVETMILMKEAGCDPLNGNNSFFLSFFDGRIAMMDYLYQQGANLYHPSVLQGLYHRKNEVSPESRAHFLQLLKKETEAYDLLYKSKADCPATMEDYRKVVQNGQTLLHIAVRAGCFSSIVKAAMEEERSPLSSADLLQKDDQGVSPLAILAARGSLADVFNPALWQKNPHDAMVLADALENSLRVQGGVDRTAVQSDILRHNLQKKARRLRFTLGPP